MSSFSTANVPGRRKLRFWNEISSETFAPMEVVARDPEAFEGKLSREHLGPIGLAEVCTSPGVVHHTELHVARADDRGYTLVAPLAGGFHVDLGTQPAFELRVGEFCLIDHCRPYRLTHVESGRTFCVGLGRRLLREFIPEPDRVVGMRMQPVCSTSRMLVSLLQNLSQEMEQGCVGGTTPALAHSLAHSLASFIAAAYSEVAEVSDESVLHTRRAAIKGYVDERLHDAQLRPAEVARHFGISDRYLRLIFESEGEPLSAYLLRRRLEGCARQLRDALWRGRTITEIAFAHGFNSATYFGHAFKRRFGMTPTDYRAITGP
jgi:AraC family transcriptional regulator, positive regulator of tynA and feaB